MTDLIELAERVEKLERVERQFSSGNGSYEAPNGIIHYRVDCRNLSAVLKLAREAATLRTKAKSND